MRLLGHKNKNDPSSKDQIPTQSFPSEERIQSFWTADNTKLFDRTFYLGEYFYCKTAKMYYLTTCKGDHCVSPCLNDNKTCSYVEMDDSVLYPGDIHGDKPDSEWV